MKSPQERRIEELEQQIRTLRERAEQAQGEWLRLQGHVVSLAAHHHKIVADINLINKRNLHWGPVAPVLDWLSLSGGRIGH